MTTAEEANLSNNENFADLLAESLGSKNEGFVGRVVTGEIISKTDDDAIIDVRLKSEGRIPLKEFGKVEVNIGDSVDVYVDKYENKDGMIVLSREKARREESWIELEKQFSDGKRVDGMIFGRVKGGFTVDLSGAVAFLPGSQVDIRPIRDINPLMNNTQSFQILKMDRSRGNIVVSRRAVLEETRAEQRTELIKNLKEGQILEGLVKNITDYGAFVDLGGVDGLLHVTDIAWKRINHPSQALQIGQNVKVQVIRFNSETQRISLGIKQLEPDPWETVSAKYPVSSKFEGRVTNITDYGAFVELEDGVEGLVHISEMSWTKKNIHPGKIVSSSQEVEVMILDVDTNKRRISLGIKQCTVNPWKNFLSLHPIGSSIEGEIKNITEFGLFIGLIGGIDGMIHLSDLSWERSGEEIIKEYTKSNLVTAKVLDVDIEKERISLGIKQLSEDPFKEAVIGIERGDTVACSVSAINDSGIEVEVLLSESKLKGFIRKSELARVRSEQKTERFSISDRMNAKVISIDSNTRKVSLSVKALELADAKQAMEDYAATDSDTGSSLGDILGEAIRKKQEKI